MAAVIPVQFSPNAEYFAYSSPDGTLKIWETTTGLLKHEYTPSSHLTATCTCVSWGSLKQLRKTPKKKKRSSVGDTAQKFMFIALGTSSGDVLLYSVTKGELHTQLSGGHTGAVNGLCWNEEGDTLYSCSDDQHIVEWDIKSSKVKHKWKGDKTSVYSVALCHTEKHLLTAGRSIKLWSLDSHQVIQTFTGHATEVFDLIPVSCSKCGHSVEASNSTNNNIDGSYFFSAAVSDRLINVWQIFSTSREKTALASFSLPDEPVHVNFRSPSQPGQTFLLSVVTKAGQISIFEHQLNGRCKVPLQHKVHIQVASSSDDLPRPLPILCSHVTGGDDIQVHLVHGNFLNPTFEKLSYKSLEQETCLVRDDTSRKLSVQKEAAISKVKTPVTSGEVTVLAPGHMAPSAPSLAPDGRVSKTKRKRLASVDMTMEDRLNAISIDKPASGATVPPKTDTLATLLAQGLQSKDAKILDSVLNRGNVGLIRNTVKKLPLPVIVPLVQELTKRLHRHAQTGHVCLKWVRVVLTTHTSYLMSFPELVDSVSSLYQLMDSRCAAFSKLARLQGKLDLMLSQISTQEEEDEGDAQQPLLVYQDESSDEDLGMEDIIHEASESEDNWEELSENGDSQNDKDSDNEHTMDTSQTAKRSHSDSESDTAQTNSSGTDSDG